LRLHIHQAAVQRADFRKVVAFVFDVDVAVKLLAEIECRKHQRVRAGEKSRKSVARDLTDELDVGGQILFGHQFLPTCERGASADCTGATASHRVEKLLSRACGFRAQAAADPTKAKRRNKQAATAFRAAAAVKSHGLTQCCAQTLRARLEASGKYQVAMTRSDDTFIALTERVKFARAQSAALFVSIHADAIPKKEGQAEGATVYTLSENASDTEAARLAEAENKADVIAGIDLTAEPGDVANILVDLAQRETKTYSGQFARTLVGELKAAARLHKNPMKAAGFKVLTAPDVPSVLVELGYMSTKGDLKLLTSTDWQAKTAAALAQAVDTYFAPRLARGAARAN